MKKSEAEVRARKAQNFETAVRYYAIPSMLFLMAHVACEIYGVGFHDQLIVRIGILFGIAAVGMLGIFLSVLVLDAILDRSEKS